MDLAKKCLKNAPKSVAVKKFFPTVEECRVNNLVKCTEEGCQSIFTSESHLTLHLVKTHKKSHLMESDSSAKQYYCPDTGCTYSNDKFFKNLKFLRQHYLKVHLAKDFHCPLCQKSFSTEKIIRNHVEYCGVNFECCDCPASYPCYETLKTHGRRKKHNILFKSEYKSKLAESKSDEVVLTSKTRLILPKQSISLVVLPSVSRSTISREMQTEEDRPKLRSKMTQVNRDISPQITQHTQTGTKNIQLTVETQTIGDFLSTSRKNLVDDLSDSANHKSSKTQTDLVESRSTSCNTSFNLDDLDLSLTPQVEKNSLGTQTSYAEYGNIYSASTTTHDSIHTDTSDLMADTLNDNMSNFEFFNNCNMETQTDFMLDDEMFSCDYMSNMYTQTCDEILNDLGFSNIQTQTVFDDMLRSVESQTLMSHGTKGSISAKDISHTETQTDMGFRKMLEVINS